MRPIEVTENSRRLEGVFERVVAHQVVNEAYTMSDDYEECDSGEHIVQVFTKSRFLDRLHSDQGWLFQTGGAGTQHYRIWTYDAVIDVGAVGTPLVGSLSRES